MRPDFEEEYFVLFRSRSIDDVLVHKNDTIQQRCTGNNVSAKCDSFVRYFNVSYVVPVLGCCTVALELVKRIGIGSLRNSFIARLTTEVGALPLLIQMLSMRNPVLLIKLVGTFDFAFCFFNVVVWALADSIGSGWEHEALVTWVLLVPLFVVSLTGDATSSHREFSQRKNWYCFALFVAVIHVMLTHGDIIHRKQVVYKMTIASYELIDATTKQNKSKDGVSAVSVYRNEPEPESEPEPNNEWAGTPEGSIESFAFTVESVGNIRLMYSIIFLLRTVWVSTVNKDRCALLTSPAVRSLEPFRDRTDAHPIRALGASSRDRLASAPVDEQTITLHPSPGWQVAHGPRHCVWYYVLFGQHCAVSFVQDCLWRLRIPLTVMQYVACVVAIAGLHTVVMEELAWVVLLAVPGILRSMLRKNTTVVLKLLATFDCTLLLLTVTVASVCMCLSFNTSASGFAIGCVFWLHIVDVILADAHISRTEIENGQKLTHSVFVFVISVIFSVQLARGELRATDPQFLYMFLSGTKQESAVGLILQLLGTVQLFLVKIIVGIVSTFSHTRARACTQPLLTRYCICILHLYIASVLHLYCICIASVLHLYCICIASVLHLYCICIASVLHLYWNCSDSVVTLY